MSKNTEGGSKRTYYDLLVNESDKATSNEAGFAALDEVGLVGEDDAHVLFALEDLEYLGVRLGLENGDTTVRDDVEAHGCDTCLESGGVVVLQARYESICVGKINDVWGKLYLLVLENVLLGDFHVCEEGAVNLTPVRVELVVRHAGLLGHETNNPDTILAHLRDGDGGGSSRNGDGRVAHGDC